MKKLSLCVICAREGSKGLKNKNILRICGYRLFEISVIQAQKSKIFDKIVISSDSETVLKYSNKMKVDLVIKRPKSLSNNNVSKMDVIKHAVLKSEKFFKQKFDFICDLDVTSPLRTSLDIHKCYKLINKKHISNVFTVIKSSKNPYFNVIELKEDKVSLVKSSNKLFSTRQSSPKTFDMNASIYFWKREILFINNNLFNKNTSIHIMEDFCIDIDNIYDFELINLIFNKNKNLYLS